MVVVGFPPAKRHAILTAFLLHVSEELTDRIMDFHRRLIGRMFRQSEKKQWTVFVDRGPAVNEKLLNYSYRALYWWLMPDDLQNRIVGIIQRVSKRPVQVSPDESLFDSGLLDSFALPDVVTAIENEFGIEVPDSDLTPRKFESIASIGRYIESRS